MAAPAHNTNAVSPETLITIKVSVNDSLKKLKLPLRDLGATVLPNKARVI
jgi:next-to-BRCA1 protein 1